jgi:Raf kinase inhibitor-like YbhB/YbcL family protein
VLATQRAKLRDELERTIAHSHAHASELREANAEVVAMWHHDVAELLEVGAKCGQLREQGGSGKLVVTRHDSSCALRAGGAMPVAWGAAVEENTWSVPWASVHKGGSMAFAIESSAFQHGGAIPRRYTCDGEDVSPPLRWYGAPEKARSFALIVDDPDAPDPAAPKRVYVHWVLYDVPASVTKIDEDGEQGMVKAGARQGKNDWARTGYGGPCPPIGRHRYFFKLYALDTMLGDLGTPTKRDLERAAMQGHVLASAELMGTYQRGEK